MKRAFQYAYDCISYYGLTNKVSLFYNDFNTYMEVNDVITMINYINSDKKICSGVGMQSHLSTTYPSVSYYTQALQSFINAGFEVQITELDATNSSDTDLANYLYSLMKNVLSIKKAGGKITGLTFWGLADDVTWIKGEKPLLFSYLNVPKSAYYSVLQAYTDSGYVQGGQLASSGNSANTSSTLKDGWYYIKNVNAQKFKAVSTGQNNVFGIVTKVSSDKKALDVYNFGTSDGANVCQWTYYANVNQKWVFEAC